MVKQVREIYPNAYVVVSSGYSDDFIIENFAEYGFNDVLSKPYTKEELGAVLQRYFSNENSI